MGVGQNCSALNRAGLRALEGHSYCSFFFQWSEKGPRGECLEFLECMLPAGLFSSLSENRFDVPLVDVPQVGFHLVTDTELAHFSGGLALTRP